MRIFRPSARAAAITGALALTLVVAGTSGAVAGKLITSKDIKDHTISAADMRADSVTNDALAPGAVSWSKSLDQATRNRIEKLLGEGVPGPTGATGPQGQQGPQGPRGDAGPTGTGRGNLVGQDYYGLTGFGATDDNGLSEVYGLNPEPITLTGPGNFLVNLSGVFTETGEITEPLLFLGDPGSGGEFDADAILNACLLSVTLYIPTCASTYPISVADGDTLTLPLLVPADVEEPCDDSCDPLVLARVAVYAMGGDVPAVTEFPDLDPCRCRPFSDRQLQRFAREYRQYLS